MIKQSGAREFRDRHRFVTVFRAQSGWRRSALGGVFINRGSRVRLDVRYPANGRLKPDIASGPKSANETCSLEVAAQFGVYLQEIWRTACRRSNILVAGPFHPWLLRSPVRWAAPSPQSQNRLPPARRKTAPVRFSPQQVQTPSFTAQKMAIPFPTLGKRGGKAPLGSQDTVSVHSPTPIGSILHGPSSEL